MKAITISQPFASLIATGEKWVENRSWGTNYRGELAIHAGKGTQFLTKKELIDWPNGCVIATAELVECVSLSWIKENIGTVEKRFVAGKSKTWRDVLGHEHTEGPFCWILANVCEIDPIPMIGKQGLWTAPLLCV